MKLNFFSLLLNTAIFMIFMAVLFFALLQANGWYLDWNEIELTKTGMLYVDGQGKEVLSLDGKKVAEDLPASISGILPGRYLLSWEKPNFFKRELWINVKTDVVTFLPERIAVPEDVASGWLEVEVGGLDGEKWFWQQNKIWRERENYLEVADPILLNWRKVVEVSEPVIGIDVWGDVVYWREKNGLLKSYDQGERRKMTEMSINRIFQGDLSLFWGQDWLLWGQGQDLQRLANVNLISALKVDFWRNGWLVKWLDQAVGVEKICYLAAKQSFCLEEDLRKIIAWEDNQIIWQNKNGEIWAFDGKNKQRWKNYWRNREIVAAFETDDYYLTRNGAELILEDWMSNQEFILTTELAENDRIWLSEGTIYWWNGQIVRQLILF